jgi:hypothetical protein
MASEKEKLLSFGEWAAMYGGPKDLQRIQDQFLQSGVFPEEFEIYWSDYEYFEKTGYWPVP